MTGSWPCCRGRNRRFGSSSASPGELRGALFRLNRDRKDEARLRLRLAVHFGVAKPGPNGYQGPGPVVLSRLCDSGPLKRVLMESGADLAVVFSRQIYADTIASGLTLLDPRSCAECG